MKTLVKYNSSDSILYMIESLDNPQFIDYLEKNCLSYCLIEVDDWNSELSPFYLKAGKEEFAGQGPKTLEALKQLIGETEKDHFFTHRYIAGYSLAGLFSLYAISTTELFDGCISGSASLWFTDFNDYFYQNFSSYCKKVYLSLGNREEKARNPFFAKVGDNTRAIYNYLKSKNIDTVLEMNEGGHFNDPSGRMIKGIDWILKR